MKKMFFIVINLPAKIVYEILEVTIDRKLTFHQHKKCVVKQIKNSVPY